MYSVTARVREPAKFPHFPLFRGYRPVHCYRTHATHLLFSVFGEAARNQTETRWVAITLEQSELRLKNWRKAVGLSHIRVSKRSS